MDDKTVFTNKTEGNYNSQLQASAPQNPVQGVNTSTQANQPSVQPMSPQATQSVPSQAVAGTSTNSNPEFTGGSVSEGASLNLNNVSTVVTPQASVLPSQPQAADTSGSPPDAYEGSTYDGGGSDGEGFNYLKIAKMAGLALGGLLLVFVIFLIAKAVLNGGSSTQATITYWGLWENDSTMQQTLDDFHKLYPNITVKYEMQDKNNYKQRLITRVTTRGSSDVPDVFEFHNSWTTSLQKQNVLAPLPVSVISKQDFEKEYYPVASKDLILTNGGLYGIPAEIDDLGLFVNNDLFKQVDGLKIPKDWYSFQNAAIQLTHKDASGKITQSGAAIGRYDTIAHAPDVISAMMNEEGLDTSSPAKLVSSNQNLPKTPDNKDRITSTIEAYISYGQDGQGQPIWDDSLGLDRTAFANGKLAMFFGYSWDAVLIKDANPNLNFFIVPIPSILNFPSQTVASYWVNGMSAGTRNQQAVEFFLKYLSQKDVQEKLYAQEVKNLEARSIGEPYARVDSSSLLKDSLASTFVSQAASAQSSFLVSDTNDDSTNDKGNEALKQAIDGILGTNGSPLTSDSAVSTFIQNLNQLP